MTEDKICPFMSRPVSVYSDYNRKQIVVLHEVKCIKDRCESWGECIRKTLNAYNEPVYEYWTGCRLIP